MNPDKFAQLQMQMTQNQRELGDYMQDLDDWTKEMKTKEEELLAGGSARANNVPPVRNAATKAEAKTKPTANNVKSNGVAKTAKPISSYDYRAWDRFDVDEALKSSSSSGSEDENTETPAASYEKEAASLKEKGNELFGQKKYSEAIEFYSAALKLQPRNATFLSNRAICYLKLDKFQEAEDDCTHALASEPRNTKALFRRATARVGLGKLEDAKKDFEYVLDLEPTNRLAKQEVDRLAESTRISKAVELIVEQEAAAKIPDWFPIPSENARDFAILKPKNWKGGQADDKMTSVPIREVSNLNHLWNSSARPISPVKAKSDAEKQAPTFVYAPPPCSWRPIPDAPTAPFQFQNDLRSLRNETDRLYTYLKKIDPVKLPELFGSSLESTVLAEIIESFSGQEPNEDTAKFFRYLQRVNRYSTVALFLDSKLKLVLDKFVQHSQSTSGNNS